MPADPPSAPPTPAAGSGPMVVPSAPGRRPLVMVWVGVVAFSTGPVIAAGSAAPGVVFSLWRLWIGALVLGGATAVRRARGAPAADRSGWRAALTAGVFFGAHQAALVSAIQTTSVVDVTLMNTIVPVVVGALAVPVLGERPGVAFRLWSAVAMAGAAAVVVAGSAGPGANPAGMALAAVNVVFYAVYFLLSKVARERIEPVPFLFGALVGGGTVVALAAAVLRQPVLAISGADVLRAAAVALVPGLLGHVSVTWALRWVPANIPPVLMLSIPVLSGALAWVFLGQGVRPGQVAAGAATLVGVAGAVRANAAARSPGGEATAEALALAEET